MLIVYDSLTGNVQRFINKLPNQRVLKINSGLEVSEPYVLVTYTIGFGEVPKKVKEFLANNHQYLKGVAASGNKNWGSNFTMSASTISQQYEVPVVHRFELSGNQTDVNIFLQEVKAIDNKYSKVD